MEVALEARCSSHTDLHHVWFDVNGGWGHQIGEPNETRFKAGMPVRALINELTMHSLQILSICAHRVSVRLPSCLCTLHRWCLDRVLLLGWSVRFFHQLRRKAWRLHSLGQTPDKLLEQFSVIEESAPYVELLQDVLEDRDPCVQLVEGDLSWDLLLFALKDEPPQNRKDPLPLSILCAGSFL